MGVSGLRKLIEDARNADACCPRQPIGGRVIIDGNDLLHELYRDFHLDWAHGGQYSQLQHAITEFFTALCSKGVQPIVVVDGGGDGALVDELVYRRNLSIVKMPEERERELADIDARTTRHYLPILAGVVFRQTIADLRQRIPFCVADGKADPTIVQLANYYRCPVLGCEGNYCIYNLAEGFVHYQDLEWRGDRDRITARVFCQRAFAQHFGLRDPSLCLLLPALLGDGCDISLKYIYGALKPLLNPDVPKCVAILNYARQFQDFQQFLEDLEREPRLGRRAKENVRTNCVKAKSLYVVASKLSLEELLQKPCQLPLSREHLKAYRKGGFLPSLLTAVAVHRCPLHYQIGSLTLPPPPAISKPIRQMTYGVLSGLSQAKPLTSVKEYYRSQERGELTYAEDVLYVTFDRFHELSITNAASYSKGEKSPLVIELFSSVLHCPRKVIEKFDTWEDSNWVLPVVATRFWATCLQASRVVPNLVQVVKALVMSFVNCNSQVAEVREWKSNWKGPDWERAHHALLQWQCVWYDVIGLNQALQEPYDAPSPATLFDGPLALHYATHDDPRAVDKAARALSAENKQLYDRVLAAVLP